MAVQIQWRRDTAANWTSVNPVLSEGEVGLETDTGKVKVGNGVGTWSALSYSFTGGSATWGTITGTLSAQTDLQGVLDSKAPLASPTFTGTVSGITKSMVGLGNVDNTSDANKPVSTATQTALDLKVDENAAITGATKTKITYDAKGLVTAGVDATTADIADSTNKRYVTDANLTVIGNTSGTNTGDQTATTVANTPAGNIAATTVQAAINELDTEKAPLASPALTGSPTAPTQTAADNSTKIATTAYADAKVADAINDSVTGIAPSQNAVFDALAAKRSFNIVPTGDTNYTIVAANVAITTSAAFTASRTWTLPAANAVAAGAEVIVADLFGGVTTTNTLVIARAGADTINGATTAIIGQAFGMRRLISDGTSKWTFDGGVARLSGGNAFTGTQTFGDGVISGFSGSISTITSFPYTLLQSDNGKILRFDTASSATVNLPDSITAGFNVAWSQSNTGVITFTPTGGASRTNRQSHTKSAGQYAMGSLVVMTNSGSNAMYNLAGDTAT